MAEDRSLGPNFRFENMVCEIKMKKITPNPISFVSKLKKNVLFSFFVDFFYIHINIFLKSIST